MDDEPVLGGAQDPEPSGVASAALRLRIHALVESQPFAVLCTGGDPQPYGSLIAFAITDDLRWATFATPVTTRKFQLLSRSDRVALLIDNRCRHQENMMEVEALTVTGRARQVSERRDLDRWSALLVGRHGYLKTFVRAPSVALFAVEIVRYFHVVRFQEVQQWAPAAEPGSSR